MDDIILILTFLTGRQVYKTNYKGEMRDYYLDSVVSSNYFSSNRSAGLKIELFIEKLVNDNLTSQFYNFCYAKCLNDMYSLICYSSFTFDSIVTKWNKREKTSSYNLGKNKGLVEEIKKYLYRKIEENIFLKLKNEVLEYLRKQKIDENICNDIVARLNIIDQPSALYKIEKFLNYHSFLEKGVNLRYLKVLNKVRNIIMHNGEIYRENKENFEQDLVINGSIPFILLSIMEFYFCKFYLDINDYYYEQNFQDIKIYFCTGSWRGQEIFNENYEQYIERISKDWESS